MITKWYYYNLGKNRSKIKTTYRGNLMFYKATVRDNIKVDYSNGSSSWDLILSSYTKISQILLLKMKCISYLTVSCVKYPHICHLCSPSQDKVKIKHYIRIHACGNLLFSSEFMWLCWDLVSYRTRAKVKVPVLPGMHELDKTILFRKLLYVLT